METLTKRKNREVKNLTYPKNEILNKSNRCSEEEIANLIIDSFNGQVHLSSRFKNRISGMIDSIEYAYPNDGVKLQKIIDLFLGSSHKLMGDYMKALLDSYLIVKQEDANDYNPIKHLYGTNKIEGEKKNKKWMEDWMEQIHFLNGHSSDLSLTDSDMENFCFYEEDVTETN